MRRLPQPTRVRLEWAELTGVELIAGAYALAGAMPPTKIRDTSRSDSPGHFALDVYLLKVNLAITNQRPR